jgi:hypothetical protein
MGGKQDVRIKGKLRAYLLQWPSFYRGGVLSLYNRLGHVTFPRLGNILSIWMPLQGCVDVGSGKQLFPSVGSCQICPIVGRYGDMATVGIPCYTPAMNSPRGYWALI